MSKNSAVNLEINNNADGFDVAGGTTKRKLTLTGADVTATGAGTSQHDFAPISGKVALVPFTSTASATVGNSASEATLIGSGVGTLTLSADFLIAGRSLEIIAEGYLSTQAVPNTINLKIKLGSTQILATGVQTPTGSITTRQWRIHAIITCRSTGVSGTVIGQGDFLHHTTTGLLSINWEMPLTTTVTINTTTTQAIDLTATWGGANAGDTITCTNFAVKILN